MASFYQILGYLAGTITTLARVPQILKILHQKNAQNISTLTSIALATGSVLWLIYGISVNAWPVILANAVTLIFILLIMGMKLYFHKTLTRK